MNIISIPRSILRFQYRLVRNPLQLIEDRVVARMGAEAPARLVFERSLGVLDATVGSALGDPRLKWRGAALAKRSEELGRAAELEAAAERKQRRADDELKARRDQAVDDQAEAREAKEQAVEDARTAAAERKRTAAETAKDRTDAAKQQADDAAAKRTESAEAAKRQEHERIKAAEKKATDAAQGKLKDANAKRDEAEDKRAQADRIEKLADVEKLKRQSERAVKS